MPLTHMPGRDCPHRASSNLFSLGSLIHPENAIELARRLDLDVLLFKRAGAICPAVFAPSSHAHILDLAVALADGPSRSLTPAQQSPWQVWIMIGMC